MAKPAVKSRKEPVEEDTEVAVTAPADAKPEATAPVPAPDEELALLRKQLADAEAKQADKDRQLTEEREKRIAAEKAREETSTKAAGTQESLLAEAALARENAVQVATANLAAIKRELREARDAGDIDKEIDLQDKLGEARYRLEGVQADKRNFEAWKEQQAKVKPVADAPAKPAYTASEQAWIDAHPRFNSDDEYQQTVFAAHNVALKRGIKPDTPAYYEHIEGTLKRYGLDVDDAPLAPPAIKPAAASAPAAPASYSAPAGGGAPSRRSFRLTPEMRDMAHRTFGPNSMWKLPNDEAEKRYAAQMLDVQERRQRGEVI